MKISELLYVNAGTFIDFDLSNNDFVNSQTGMGFLLGFGFEKELTERLSIYCLPYYKYHALVPFPLSFGNHNLSELGLRIGCHVKL